MDDRNCILDKIQEGRPFYSLIVESTVKNRCDDYSKKGAGFVVNTRVNVTMQTRRSPQNIMFHGTFLGSFTGPPVHEIPCQAYHDMIT